MVATKEKRISHPVVEFDESNHEYWVRRNGHKENVPGTTTITGVLDKSQPLIWWAVNCARDYILEQLQPGEPLDELEIEELAKGARLAHRNASDKAKSLGTLVHDWIEDYIDTQIHNQPEPDWPVNEDSHECIIEFLDWEESNDVEWGASEVVVYHPEAHYAGTYDALAKVNGRITIVEFKTASGIYGEHKLQTTAYLRAEEQYRERNIDGITILRVPKDAQEFETYECYDNEELQGHFEGFLGARELLSWQMNYE